MTRRVSAGILLYRWREGVVEVLLGHPGGPFFIHRDLGNWTIPKGEPGPEDSLEATAAREFREETGYPLESVARDRTAAPMDLGSVLQASGKRVHCWATEGDLDPAAAVSNTFEMAWPPGTDRIHTYPEIDRVVWFAIDEARRRANPSQAEFMDRLIAMLEARGPA